MIRDPFLAGIILALLYSHVIAFAFGRVTARCDVCEDDDSPKHSGRA